MRETEYLSLVAMEECAEIQQALAKALRFGFDDRHPAREEKSNEEEVLLEFYQLVAMMEEMQRQNIIKQLSNEQIEAIKQDKIRKVYKYLEYSKQMGTVDS